MDDDTINVVLLTMRLARRRLGHANISLAIRAVGGDLSASEILHNNNTVISLLEIALSKEAVKKRLEEMDKEWDDDVSSYLQDNTLWGEVFGTEEEEEGVN